MMAKISLYRKAYVFYLFHKAVFMEQIEYIRLPLKSTINTLKTALPF